MPPVTLGAVTFLNARPLVYGLERSPRFSIRFDVPSRCADLLHSAAVDVGLIPSIEYLRGPSTDYAIVPGVCIASRGPVDSVALYTTRDVADIRSLALDTSSRTSVALVQVLCGRVFGIRPAIVHHEPDLARMLAQADAALIIGDVALLQGSGPFEIEKGGRSEVVEVQKIDLGETWIGATGTPFVFAFWAGRAGCLAPADVAALQQARDAGLARTDEIARAYFPGMPEAQAVGARYLRDNIRYELGAAEHAGLELFYRYAADAGLVERPRSLRFFDADR